MATGPLLLLLFAGLFSPQGGDGASELQMCIDNFVVHPDKIIRTQDSRALGAKYLTETEVTSREDCLQLCCETVTCDVFVYEHKRRGSCYLFHCGDPSDFKCKFTEHKNYSSGLLMPANELEAQIKLTKHEEELAQLSKKTEVGSVGVLETTQSTLPTTTQVPVHSKVNNTAQSECSRYQFECRSNHECIAIYNVCDGIPQCPDSSDEGPELECPKIAIGATQPGAAVHSKILPSSVQSRVSGDVKKSFVASQTLPYPQYEKPVESSHQQAIDAQQQLESQVKTFGREGEGPQEPPPQWHNYMTQPRRPQDEGNRIFNHKGGIVTDGDSGQQNPYSNEMARGAAQNYYGNNPYNAPSYSNWPLRRGDDPRWMYPGPPQPPDYYYEESQMRARPPPPALNDHRPGQLDPSPSPVAVPTQKPVESETPQDKVEERTTLSKVESEKPKAKETLSVKKVIPEKPAKVESQTVPQSINMVMNEDDVVILEADGENERPRGAILSLSLGMCIAAIMITLVGCRLRIVQRRLRRGKGSYAHDADFLVNGMYL